MRIAIYGGKCLPIHARTLEERPLGGTETGIIRVAEELSRRNYEVTVFSTHTSPPKSVPEYRPVQSVLESGSFDVFITVRDWWPAIFRVPARAQFFWSGDAYDQYVSFGLGDRRVAQRIDRFLVVSQWQAHTMCEASGFPIEKCVFIGNGVELSNFEGSEPRGRKRMIFSSTPYRGLALTPPMIETLRKFHPDLEFHIFSGLAVYDGDQPFQGPELDQWARLKGELAPIPGVNIHGNLIQKQLAREFMRSSILFYPNTFMETSCITAMEAQAAGCAIVTSALAALPETVGASGILIPGTPGSAPYMRSFIEATHRLLSDDPLWESCSRAGRERAEREFSWAHVVDRLELVLKTV